MASHEQAIAPLLGGKKPNERKGADKVRTLALRKDEDPEFFRAAKEVERAGRTLLGLERLYTLWQMVGNACHTSGAFVEIGAYRGGSAHFIARALERFEATDRRLHVVDTFEGHPDFVTDSDLRWHPPGHFGDTSYDDVKSYLGCFKHVIVHKGAFEDVHDTIPEGQFCCAHIDVDTYISTKNCLEFFDAHMSSGGIVVLDDFGASKCAGVKQAADEFITSRWERYRIVRLHTEQAMLVRL